MPDWLFPFIAPLFSALLSGGLMYVAVRVQLAKLDARQELTLQMLQSIQAEQHVYRAEISAVRERLASLEAIAKAQK